MVGANDVARHNQRRVVLFAGEREHVTRRGGGGAGEKRSEEKKRGEERRGEERRKEDEMEESDKKEEKRKHLKLKVGGKAESQQRLGERRQATRSTTKPPSPAIFTL